MATLTEADAEAVALEWLAAIGWQIAYGPDIALDTPGAERDDYGQVMLERRRRDALHRLNPQLPTAALDDALRKLTQPEGATLAARNRAFHRMLVNGVTVEYRAGDDSIRGDQVQIADFDEPASNDWLAVNQLTVTEVVGGNRNTRRPDILLFLNGLPLGVIELKNPADEDATIWAAWQQLQTHQAELPTLSSKNGMLIASDRLEARIGARSAGREWFKPWRTITGETLADAGLAELQVLLEGACHPDRFLALVRDFTVFDYLGQANDLRQALVTYTESGGTGRTAIDKEAAVAVMLEKHEVCCALFHGFDWSKWTTGAPTERLGLLPAAQEHILAQENGKDRCMAAVRELSRAFALAVPHAETFRVRDDVGFFQAVRAALSKRAAGEARPEEDLDLAVRQIVSRAVASEGVLNIFAAAGLDKLDISVLSEESLAEVQGMPQRNLAVELLRC